MKAEKWIEICKEMAPHLRALELIAKNNALDVICIGMGVEATGQATWIEDDTGTHFRYASESDCSFKVEISNRRTGISEKYLLPIEKAPGAGKHSGTKENQSSSL